MHFLISLVMHMLHLFLFLRLEEFLNDHAMFDAKQLFALIAIQSKLVAVLSRDHYFKILNLLFILLGKLCPPIFIIISISSNRA